MPNNPVVIAESSLPSEHQPAPDMQLSYRGSCHCGQVTFELQAKLENVFDCNCSLCRRMGALWHGASESHLRIIKGENQLTLYQFNTMTAKHYFCRHCGVHPFTRPRLDPGSWVVNVRCLDDVDLSSLRIRQFDGDNWEDAAKALHAHIAFSQRSGKQ